MRFRVAFPAAIVAAWLLVPVVPALAEGRITQAQPHLPAEPLTITAAGHRYRFQVEVARTFEQQEIGLMYRTSVPPFGGMIFPMKPIREATFWMQNTVIPLDMLFIRADGTIARITTAKALSTDIDDSGEPVAAVLELSAGRAAELGIKQGDRVSWRGLPR
jgi:uncharacterized membrane protein (UPF0127 family)